MESEVHGEGLDHGLAYMVVRAMVEEAKADRFEIISGRDADESWKEVSAQSLPMMFQTFRKILAKQMTDRCKLNTTPPNHILLALKMHPAINTDKDGPQLAGKQAKGDLMDAEYKRALRRQALLGQRHAPTVSPAQPTASPTTTAPDTPATATAAARLATAAPAPKRRKRRG
jgi:hypothetical protein